MPSRVLKVLLVIALIAGAVSYLFYFNATPITFSLGAGREWRPPLALFVVIVFCLGGVFAGLLAIVFGLRRFIDEKKRARRDRTWKRHLELLIKGREKLASRDFIAARQTFERMVAEDRENIIARVMLAETIAAQGETLAALQVLDEARQKERRNIEFLILGARLNEQLGNLTAAYDNMAIAVQISPENPFVLEQAASLAERIGRYELAVSHLEELASVSPRDAQDAIQSLIADAQLKVLLRDNQNSPAQFRGALEGLLKKHRDYPGALAALATLEANEHHYDLAERALTRAYRTTGDTSHLKSLAELWLAVPDPTRAVQSVKTTVDQHERATGEDLAGHLFLASLYHRLEMIGETEGELAKISGDELPPELRRNVALLRAVVLNRKGKFEEAFDMVSHLIPSNGATDHISDRQTAESFASGKLRRERDGLRASLPSPRLSVP